MKATTIYRLIKSAIFIFVLILSGVTSGITSQVFFAITLALYLMELYLGIKE